MSMNEVQEKKRHPSVRPSIHPSIILLRGFVHSPVLKLGSIPSLPCSALWGEWMNECVLRLHNSPGWVRFQHLSLSRCLSPRSPIPQLPLFRTLLPPPLSCFSCFALGCGIMAHAAFGLLHCAGFPFRHRLLSIVLFQLGSIDAARGIQCDSGDCRKCWAAFNNNRGLPHLLLAQLGFQENCDNSQLLAVENTKKRWRVPGKHSRRLTRVGTRWAKWSNERTREVIMGRSRGVDGCRSAGVWEGEGRWEASNSSCPTAIFLCGCCSHGLYEFPGNVALVLSIAFPILSLYLVPLRKRP